MKNDPRNFEDNGFDGGFPGRTEIIAPSREQIFPRPITMAAPSERASEEPGRGGASEYWRSLRSHKLTLALLGLLGIGLGCLVSISQTRLYQAHASLEIEEATPDPSEMKADRSSETGESSALSDMPTQIKILQSDSLIARALDKLKRE